MKLKIQIDMARDKLAQPQKSLARVLHAVADGLERLPKIKRGELKNGGKLESINVETDGDYVSWDAWGLGWRNTKPGPEDEESELRGK